MWGRGRLNLSVCGAQRTPVSGAEEEDEKKIRSEQILFVSIAEGWEKGMKRWCLFVHRYKHGSNFVVDDFEVDRGDFGRLAVHLNGERRVLQKVYLDMSSLYESLSSAECDGDLSEMEG